VDVERIEHMIGKRHKAALTKVTKPTYTLQEAFSLVKEAASVKFNESVDLAVRLGVDPRHSDQMVRGSATLPHGTGKKVRIVVFAKGEKEKEARDAGADFVGMDDLIEKINKGWMDFDTAVATPDVMAIVGKLGKVLGPRGLMPNPKMGTVTFEVGKAIKDLRQGKVEYRVEKAGIFHGSIGRISFSAQQLFENASTVIEAIIKARPASVKGQYLRGITVSSTMGPGIHIDVTGMDHLK
jgi:large subunit ribosomal protein L1